MSGFSFSLKANKVGKDKKVKPGGLFAKKQLPKKKSLFGEEESASNTKTSIDAFDSTQGAMSGSTAISKTPELIIEPVHKSHTLRKPNVGVSEKPNGTNSDEIHELSAEEKARKSLLAGELMGDSNQQIIAAHLEDMDAETAQEDYEAVPVDQFGAALLRGMGWSGDSEPPQSSANKMVSNRKQGAVLGIGAKSIEKELEAELLSKKNLSVPLLRREK